MKSVRPQFRPNQQVERKPLPAPTPVYRPQPQPRVLQRKSAKLPTAPPVYRPQAVPKVLQTKLRNQPPTDPLRSRTNFPPPIVQRKTIPDRTGPTPVIRAALKPNLATVIQRAEEAKPLGIKKMQEIAAALNAAPSGKKESRNTQALVLTEDGESVMVTQREYSAFDAAIEAAEEKHAGLRIDERVIADNDDEGIHAEMLAVSWWLLGRIAKPVKIAASQPICARCQAVLDALKIQGGPKGGHKTASWCHPYRNAGMVPPKGKLRALPQKVTKNVEYSW